MTESKENQDQWTAMLYSALLIIQFFSFGSSLSFTSEGALDSNNTFRLGSSATMVCEFNITSDVSLMKSDLAAVTCVSSSGKCDVNASVIGSYSVSLNSSGVIRLNIPSITTHERDVPFSCASESSKETITIKFGDQPVVFKSIGSTDENNTFLTGSNATLVCHTETDPVNLVLGINNTSIVDCSNNICYISKNVSGKYSVNVNYNLGQINLHIRSVSVEDTYNNFTCESTPNKVAIQLRTLKDKGSVSGEEKAGIVHAVVVLFVAGVVAVVTVVMY